MYSFECNRRICFSRYKCSKCKYFLDCSSCFYVNDCKFSGSDKIGYFCGVNSYLRYIQPLENDSKLLHEKKKGK